MNKQQIKERIEQLLDLSSKSEDETELKISATELHNATLNLMVILYSRDSIQVNDFLKQIEGWRERNKHHIDFYTHKYSRECLKNLLSEVDLGLIESLQKTITGEVLSDFLQLARHALEKQTEGAKNVSAVLSAALFEDTIRRLATISGIEHKEKLADTLTELKNLEILKGAQVGIAQSYLNFRNNSLHADWEKIDRPEIQSVLGFTEELLLKYFSNQ